MIFHINGIEVNKEPPLYGGGYWNGQKIPTEEEPLDEEDKEFLKEWDNFLDDLDKRRF